MSCETTTQCNWSRREGGVGRIPTWHWHVQSGWERELSREFENTNLVDNEQNSHPLSNTPTCPLTFEDIRNSKSLSFSYFLFRS